MRPPILYSLTAMVIALVCAYAGGVFGGHIGASMLVSSGIVGMVAMAIIASDIYGEGMEDGWAQREEEEKQ